MPQAHGGSIGQKPHVPTDRDREYVRRNVFFMGQDRCSRHLGVSVSTLRKYYEAEIRAADDEFLVAGGKTAMQRALSGDGPMLRFVLATRFPDLWSPKYQLLHRGKIAIEEKPIDLTAFLEGKSEDELAEILAGLDAIIAAGGIDYAVDGSGGEEADGGEEAEA